MTERKNASAFTCIDTPETARWDLCLTMARVEAVQLLKDLTDECQRHPANPEDIVQLVVPLDALETQDGACDPPDTLES